MIHIDLGAAGFPDQFIDVADIGAKSPNQFRRIQELATADSQQGARAFLAAVIESWNVLDPETGQPVPLPSDPALDLGALPMRITRILNDEVTRQLEEVVPKGSLTSSTLTSSMTGTR